MANYPSLEKSNYPSLEKSNNPIASRIAKAKTNQKNKPKNKSTVKNCDKKGDLSKRSSTFFISVKNQYVKTNMQKSLRTHQKGSSEK